jgi:hypothetical protein
MTMQDAINSCHSDELYGSPDTRLPMLLAIELDDNVRVWVIIHDLEAGRWANFYIAQGRSLDDVLDIYLADCQEDAALKWLSTPCTTSNAWQVLSLEELAEINQRDYNEIPHRGEQIIVQGCTIGAVRQPV